MKHQPGFKSLVVGGNYFLGFPLCRFLLEKGSQVTWISQLTLREKKRLSRLADQNFSFKEKIPSNLSGINYLFFFLDDNRKEFNRLVSSLKDQSVKILVIAPAETKKEIFEKYKKIDLRVVRFFNLYGPGMPLKEKSHLSRLFNQAITGGPLTIPGEGWEKIAPLYVDDLIKGLGQAIFSQGTRGKIFDFTGDQSISLISLAYLLQKKSPLRPEIEYVADDYDEKKKTDEDWQFLGVKPAISLEKGIEKTISWFAKEKEWLIEEGEEEEEGKEEKKEKPLVEIKFRPKFQAPARKWVLFVLLWLLILLSPLVFYGAQVVWGLNSFRHLKDDVTQGDLTKLVTHAQRADKALVLIGQGLDWFGKGVSLIGLGERVENLNQTVFFAKETTGGIYHLGLVGQKSGALFTDFLKGEAIDPQLFSSIQLELETAISKLSLAQTVFFSVKDRFSFWPEEIKRVEELFPEANRSLVQAKEMMALLPKIILTSEKKTYLVLFQNNMEIRPTGGFIGSFGLLTIEDGRLLDFEIHDVYFADGQLKGHVEPPAKLKEFLGEAGWYLRDSNWSPDFPTSAQRAEWFLDKEIGRKVDGVMAINLFLIERILEATGDLYLPDYDETINADNFFERAEYHSEAGFFPGSTQKQDYLGKVADALFGELKSAEMKDLTKIGLAFLASLEKKDILIYLEDEEINAYLIKFNWDGGIKGANCRLSGGECFQDYLHLNEANVGVNKANYFIDREIEQAIVINQDGLVKSRLVLNYQNNSPSDVFPAGDYRNYLRILLPLGSELNRIVIKNPDGETKEVERIDHETDYQREIFGFLVEVPVGEKRKVEIEYQSRKQGKVKPGSYLLLVQKQSGAKDDQYSLSITYPDNFFLAEMSPQALTREGLVVYNTNLSRDTAFELVFEEKK